LAESRLPGKHATDADALWDSNRKSGGLRQREQLGIDPNGCTGTHWGELQGDNLVRYQQFCVKNGVANRAQRANCLAVWAAGVWLRAVVWVAHMRVIACLCVLTHSLNGRSVGLVLTLLERLRLPLLIDVLMMTANARMAKSHRVARESAQGDHDDQNSLKHTRHSRNDTQSGREFPACGCYGLCSYK
jgi:hypothetical protein